MRLWIQNHNDVTLNYQTGVKWMMTMTCHISSMQNNHYKVGTHASFIFDDMSTGH